MSDHVSISGLSVLADVSDIERNAAAMIDTFNKHRCIVKQYEEYIKKWNKWYITRLESTEKVFMPDSAYQNIQFAVMELNKSIYKFHGIRNIILRNMFIIKTTPRHNSSKLWQHYYNKLKNALNQ